MQRNFSIKTYIYCYRLLAKHVPLKQQEQRLFTQTLATLECIHSVGSAQLISLSLAHGVSDRACYREKLQGCISRVRFAYAELQVNTSL
jgi:hypothetical protein